MMKKQEYILLSLTAIVAACAVFTIGQPLAYAGDKGQNEGGKDDTQAKKAAGPNGGRLITSVSPHLEFFLTKDRKVKITAVDSQNKPIAVVEQSIKVTGGSRLKPTQLQFQKQDGVLISTKPFPEGNKLPVIVQIKASPEAKTMTERFYLDQSRCQECKHEEYACICDH